MEESAGPTGVVNDMMKASGGFVTMWMTDLISNIVKECCIPDDWRKITLVPEYKRKCDPIMCGHTELDYKINIRAAGVLESVGKEGQLSIDDIAMWRHA